MKHIYYKTGEGSPVFPRTHCIFTIGSVCLFLTTSILIISIDTIHQEICGSWTSLRLAEN